MNRLFLATTLLAAAAVPAGELPVDQAAPGTDARWMRQHEYLTDVVRRASRAPRLDIYFLGDSIIEFWPRIAPAVWKAEFGKMRVLNCGISGDTTQNILWRITHGELEGISPRVVVLLAGINNLGRDPRLAPDELARELQRLVETVRAKSPESKILLLSIFPTAAPGSPIRARIIATNQRLASLADGESIIYLDIHDAFLGPDGQMPASITPDGLHLNERGYRIWAGAMRGKLRELVSGPAES